MKPAKVVSIDPEIMSGTPCFTGTPVPVQNLLDYIESNHTLEEFFQDFPRVTREQVETYFAETRDRYIETLKGA